MFRFIRNILHNRAIIDIFVAKNGASLAAEDVGMCGVIQMMGLIVTIVPMLIIVVSGSGLRPIEVLNWPI